MGGGKKNTYIKGKERINETKVTKNELLIKKKFPS